MFSFVNRLYGLSINNFFDYSFFYFFLIKKSNIKDIKFSYLYNKSFSKINQAFVSYSKVPTKLFSIYNVINSFYISKTITSLCYNQHNYTSNYYSSTIRNSYLKWVKFLNISKNINLIYYKKILLFMFLKQYKLLFYKRFKKVTLI